MKINKPLYVILVLISISLFTIPLINLLVPFNGRASKNQDDLIQHAPLTSAITWGWTNKNPATSPGSRRYHAMVYDSTNDRTILFGGSDSSAIDDTWAYDCSDNMWTNKTTQGSSNKPPARMFHNMVYDSTNDRTILFGGYDGNFLADTWVYNYTDNSWTNRTTPGSSNKPPARFDHAMVYDSTNDRTILFGGYDGNFLADTWVYNYTDNSWTNRTTLGSSNKPPARYQHTMVYDSTNDRTILFGGYGDSNFLDDTWVYNYSDNSWTNRTTPGSSNKPPARINHAMVYDPMNERTTIFGGEDMSSNDLADTWIYNHAENTWSDVSPSTSPSSRSQFSMVYDSTNEMTVLFGGYNDTALDDTWVLGFIDDGEGNGGGGDGGGNITGFNLILIGAIFAISIVFVVKKLNKKKRLKLN